MSNEQVQQVENVEQAPVAKRVKTKRDILRFNGAIVKAIDLGKCISVDLDPSERKIIFRSANREADYIQLDTEDGARSVYETILNLWAGDVLE